jgi:SH3-like domain-containing protein
MNLRTIHLPRPNLAELVWIGLAVLSVLFGAATAFAQGSETAGQGATGRVTGFHIPRFVSLKSGEVNLRHGPGASYQIDWVFQRRGMPVEVIAEYDNWRKVRTHDGTEGWVHYQLLDGRRMGLVKGGQAVLFRRQDMSEAAVVALVEPGVILHLRQCGPDWCRAEVGGFKGWITRQNLWGVYAEEEFD